MMPSSLPSEILDLIVDHLHGDPTALRVCCIAGKSWIPRARKHLFAHVEFHTQKSHIERWKKTFPDPSNSPARYAHTLSIRGLSTITAAGIDAGGWIPTFHKVIQLRLECLGGGYQQAFLIPFHGLSPTVKSLHLTSYPSSTFFEVFDLVCSFPLLEDLALVSFGPESDLEGWNAPSTSPKLTGSLDLKTIGGTRSVIHRLLNLPGGLCFVKITVSCLSRDFESTTELVSRCSGTLESLTIYNWLMDADASRPPLLDLSEATKLEDVVFWCIGSGVRWITMALQTVKSQNLQQITIQQDATTLENGIEERVRREWLELDHLLTQFWTSHSIRPQVVYEPGGGSQGMRHLASGLLPELTRRGLVDLVETPPSLRITQ